MVDNLWVNHVGTSIAEVIPKKNMRTIDLQHNRYTYCNLRSGYNTWVVDIYMYCI